MCMHVYKYAQHMCNVYVCIYVYVDIHIYAGRNAYVGMYICM